MLHLDGSYGEGGGQLVRTSLSLAALLGEPVKITDIRAGRAKPGLRPQHLTGVEALARITRAEVEGATLGSREVIFKPRTIQAGSYFFDVAEKTGSAGAVTLVAQALLPPLLAAREPTSLTIRGGTHVPWSPSAHYLIQVFLPALAELGAEVSLTLSRWGWYPRGGGEVGLRVLPRMKLAPRQWLEPPDPAAFQALSAASTSRQPARTLGWLAMMPTGRPPSRARAVMMFWAKWWCGSKKSPSSTMARITSCMS